MTTASNLPRVTYSNIRVDFSGVHAELDRRIGEFERRELGRLRANCIAGRDDTRGAPYAVASPIDALSLVQLKLVAVPAKVTRVVLAPLQMIWSPTAVTVGVGWTVIVNVCGVPSQSTAPTV